MSFDVLKSVVLYGMWKTRHVLGLRKVSKRTLQWIDSVVLVSLPFVCHAKTVDTPRVHVFSGILAFPFEAWCCI